MWTYSQSSGLLTRNGQRVGIGYSGHGSGVDNPALQQVKDVGPIPQGVWMINPPRMTDKHGPYVMPLTAKAGTQTFGRDGFLIHGDLVNAPGQELASEGCIILARETREAIWTSNDHDLEVVE